MAPGQVEGENRQTVFLQFQYIYKTLERGRQGQSKDAAAGPCWISIYAE
jgi:hypothetical protein